MRISKHSWFAVVFAAMALFAAGSMLSFSTASASSTFCPGDNYCYTANGCESGCKNVSCIWGNQCPDPGQRGSNCYICSSAIE
jgi:hypothetical protein